MNQLSGYYSPSNKIEPGGFSKLFAYGFIGTLPFAAAAGYLTYFVGSNKIVLTEVVVGVAPDVDAMINEISWTHRVKSKFLELIGW